MVTQNPNLSLDMDRSGHKSCEPSPLPSSILAGVGGIRLPSPEERKAFRIILEQLLTTLEVTDVRNDVPMRSFLKWRMQTIWFLCRYLGDRHPYTVEFMLTVEREADPYVNARFIVAGQAILEALLTDFDEGHLFFNDE
jgi:hypothetical protein